MRPSLVHIDVLPRPQAKALRLALGLEEGRLSHPRRAVQPARQAPAEACQLCVGMFLVSAAITRPRGVSAGEPVTLTYQMRPPGEDTC